MRWLAMLLFAACASTPHLRFANAPPVLQVDDRHDVKAVPTERPFLRIMLHFDSYYLQFVRTLKLTRDRRALGVNSFDEVPDSTWFTNRTGKRALTLDEIRRGPGLDSPERHLPWTIMRLKAGGTAPGFVIKDNRGTQFLLKFDRPGFPELETAVDAIVARLLWATGYNVPSDHVVYFTPGELLLSPDAYMKVGDKKKPLDKKLVDATFAALLEGTSGKLRGIASLLVDGKPLGGTPRVGVRRDDPNDRIPHELRRDIRGQAAVISWLAHADVKEDNTIDVWQPDPATKDLHYVVHYLLDFGEALGADIAVNKGHSLGYEYSIDFGAILKWTVSLGLAPSPWKARTAPGIRGIGVFSDDYNPGAWKTSTPAHLPVIWADRFDRFWGSKIIIRFTRDQLEAAVDSGRFTDPRAKPYLVDTLVARQRSAARYWFARVNPIDDFAIEGDRLCFTDLALRHQLETVATQFTATSSDAASRSLKPPTRVAADPGGRACISLDLAGGQDRYTILHVNSSRGMPGTQIHVAIDPATGRPRVIGIHRL